MSVKHTHEVEAKNVAAGQHTTIQVLISSQEGPNFALRKFSMKPGGGMPLHTNTVEHEQYVLGGRARIGIGEQECEDAQLGFGSAGWVARKTPRAQSIGVRPSLSATSRRAPCSTSNSTISSEPRLTAPMTAVMPIEFAALTSMPSSRHSSTASSPQVVTSSSPRTSTAGLSGRL